MSGNEANPMFARNLGFWSQEEFAALQGATVALAGAGGDGGELAKQLTQAGVGELRLADPEKFEPENKNRQTFCDDQTVGMNKAEAVAAGCSRLNSELTLVTYTDGVTPDNIGQFVRGADVVIDETEFTMPHLGVMIARAARKEGIPNVMAMNIGFGGTVTSFHPDGKFTFEDMLGLSNDMPLEEIAQQDVPLERWLPYLPDYIDLAMLHKVATGEKSAPSLAVGVAMAAGIAAVEAQLHIVRGAGIANNRRDPIFAPEVKVMDAMNGDSKIVIASPESYETHISVIAERNAQKLVPLVSY